MEATIKVKEAKLPKVKSILISQPEPESGKSPYYDLAKRYKAKATFQQFIEVQGLTSKEFRRARITVTDYNGIIFTSRTAIDYFFSLCDELRVKMSQETKYFCSSETVALYLQKYIQYRKRKVFFGDGTLKELQNVMKKYKDTVRVLYPCSEVRKPALPNYLKENGFTFAEAVIYRMVATDLSEMDLNKYDIVGFFSPAGVKSLQTNFPKFEQGNLRIAAFGSATCKAVVDAGLRLDIEAPSPKARSMSMAIENYLKEANK